MVTASLPKGMFDYARSDDGFLIREDVLCWARWCSIETFPNFAGYSSQSDDYLVFSLEALFKNYPEFRSLWDYRAKRFPDLRGICSNMRRATELHISCPEIGPRFRIQHGYSTIIYAKKIGSDFFVGQNVTIGSHDGNPTIRDRVAIRTGAVVVGAIVVGDDAVISANAVVACDVPAAHVAYAPRTVYLPRKRRSDGQLRRYQTDMS